MSSRCVTRAGWQSMHWRTSVNCHPRRFPGFRIGQERDLLIRYDGRPHVSQRLAILVRPLLRLSSSMRTISPFTKHRLGQPLRSCERSEGALPRPEFTQDALFIRLAKLAADSAAGVCVLLFRLHTCPPLMQERVRHAEFFGEAEDTRRRLQSIDRVAL